MVESFRPGVVDRLGIGYEAVRAVNSRHRLLLDERVTARTARAPAWAGHDLDYLAVGGYLAATRPARRRRAPRSPAPPSPTRAGGGMHAALAICAALVGRATTGEGTFLDVSVADGVLWLMSLAADEHLATGTEPGPGHDVLTGRYACYDTYRAADGRWLAVAAIEAKFFANLCRALGLRAVDRAPVRRRRPGGARGATSPPPSLAATATTGWPSCSGADTCVAPVQAVSEIGDDPQYRVPRRGGRGQARRHAGRSVRWGRCWPAWRRCAEPVCVPDAEATDTDELLGGGGRPRRDAWPALRARKVVA